MKTYLVNNKTIKAKSKLQALKNSGFDNIYWTGNTPYSMIWSIYPKKITAIIIK